MGGGKWVIDIVPAVGIQLGERETKFVPFLFRKIRDFSEDIRFAHGPNIKRRPDDVMSQSREHAGGKSNDRR